MGATAACNNNLSEVVSVSCSLQKLLVFFMMLDAAWMVIGYSFWGPLLSFLFHFIVFRSVRNQRTGVLLLYVVLNVIVLSFAAVGMLFTIAAMSMEPVPDGSMSSSESQMYISEGFKSMFSRSFSSSSSEEHSAHPHHHMMPGSSSSSSASASSSSSSSSSSSDSYDGSDMFIAASIILLVSLIILYCKIYSVVLAARLRRLLLATPVLPVHVALPVDGVSSGAHADNDTKPLLSEQQQEPMYDEAAMYGGYPGFAAPMQPQLFYPNIQQGGAPSMMPPPFMYGQHPVFYTFAPAPQPNNNNNEKQ